MRSAQKTYLIRVELAESHCCGIVVFTITGWWLRQRRRGWSLAQTFKKFCWIAGCQAVTALATGLMVEVFDWLSRQLWG